MGVDKKVANDLYRVMTCDSLTTVELFMAITTTSNLQIKDVFAEIDVDEQIQKMLRDVLLESWRNRVYTVKKGRLFYKDRIFQ